MSFVTTYSGWRIDCMPYEAPQGKFVARAEISAAAPGGAHVTGLLTPDAPPFDSQRIDPDLSSKQSRIGRRAH